jgi:hypothetical protein
VRQFGATTLDGSRAGAALHVAHVHVISMPMSIDAIPILDEAIDAQERTGEQAYLGHMAKRPVASAALDVRAAVRGTSQRDGSID